MLTNTEGNYAKTFGCTTQHASLFLDSADEILLLKSGRVEQHYRNEHTETENKIERKCLLVNKESIHEEVIPSEVNHLTIDGHPFSHYNIKHLRQNVVIVPAEPNLFDLTIWENICYGFDREPSHEEVELATKRAYSSWDFQWSVFIFTTVRNGKRVFPTQIFCTQKLFF